MSRAIEVPKKPLKSESQVQDLLHLRRSECCECFFDKLA